jgi:peptidoglycan/LPS O-acetylase OafA/YrhL
VVNGQLWSIPYELLCYAGLAGLVLIGGRSRRWIVPAFALASMLAFAALHLWRQGDPTLLSIEYGPRRGLFISWAFLWGASLYLYRGQVPWTRGAFGLAALVAAAAHLFEGHVTYLGPISIAYVTVYLGLAKVPSFPRLRAVDISYGLYLHHWLAMQTVMLFAPPGWRSAAFLGLPAAFALAGLSWFFVEKPAQRLRGPLLAADRRNGGTPLALSVFVAAALLGFVASFNLYPFLY